MSLLICHFIERLNFQVSNIHINYYEQKKYWQSFGELKELKAVKEDTG